MNQTTAPIKRRTKARIMLVIILRFLLIGFFSFLGFWNLVLAGEEFVEAFNSPVCSSKSKAWTGLRKSAVASIGDERAGDDACGDCGVGEVFGADFGLAEVDFDLAWGRFGAGFLDGVEVAFGEGFVLVDFVVDDALVRRLEVGAGDAALVFER